MQDLYQEINSLCEAVNEDVLKKECSHTCFSLLLLVYSKACSTMQLVKYMLLREPAVLKGACLVYLCMWHFILFWYHLFLNKCYIKWTSMAYLSTKLTEGIMSF